MVERIDKVEVTGEIRKETDLVWLIFDGTVEGWAAKSQCILDKQWEGTPLNKNMPKRMLTVQMPEWMAKRNGFV